MLTVCLTRMLGGTWLSFGRVTISGASRSIASYSSRSILSFSWIIVCKSWNASRRWCSGCRYRCERLLGVCGDESGPAKMDEILLGVCSIMGGYACREGGVVVVILQLWRRNRQKRRKGTGQKGYAWMYCESVCIVRKKRERERRKEYMSGRGGLGVSALFPFSLELFFFLFEKPQIDQHKTSIIVVQRGSQNAKAFSSGRSSLFFYFFGVTATVAPNKDDPWTNQQKNHCLPADDTRWFMLHSTT